MSEALLWWLSATLLGVLAFPIAFAFLPALADRGYAFSRTIGLLLLSYGIWIAGTAHVLPHQRSSIVLLLLVLAAVALLFAWRQLAGLAAFLREHAAYVLVVEAVFAAAFGVSLFLRSHVAEINSIEQPMEFAMLNTILRGRYFPPLDPWLAGETVNYHYFGFLQTGVVTKLTGVSPGQAFNLGLSLFIGLAFTAGFGLVYNVAARYGGATVRWGRLNAGAVGLAFLGILLLFIFSNFEGVMEMLAAHGLGPQWLYDKLAIAGLDGPRESVAAPDRPPISHAWYPTENGWWIRAIGYWGIWTEFPFFSFHIGNLHPHLIGMAATLVSFGLGWHLFAGDGAPLHRPWRHPLHFALTGVIIGSLLPTNGWNFPIALAFLMVFALLKLYRAAGKFGRLEAFRLLIYGGAVVGLSLLLYLPFLVTTHFPIGLRRATGPVVEPTDLTIMWGFFLVVVFALAVFAILRHPKSWRFSWRQLVGAAVIGTAPVAAWAVSGRFLQTSTVPDLPYMDATGWWTVFILTSLLTLVALAVIRQLPLDPEHDSQLPLVFSLVSAAMALLLLLAAELFIVWDPMQARFNTIGKSWLMAWLFLAISSSFALFWMVHTWPRGGISRRVGLPAWSGLVIVLLLAGLVYPVAVTYSRTFNFARVRPSDGIARTIDGTAFLKRHNPEELEALEWLDENVKGQPVILEATRASWIGYGDVSGYTGLVTVLGWPTHEFQWRGDWDAFANPDNERLKDVERAYTSAADSDAQQVIEKYNVEYVYVGKTEREFYGEIAPDDSVLDKFGRFMDTVFQNDAVTIYKVRPSGSAVSER